ncbi:MAG TPA: hypothetical protein VKH44_02195, partial [Pirellulaceae bacterium]|nr:hypothetical protein [Pirellulaceae bacterium]
VVVDQGAVKDFLRQISSPELKDGDWVDIAKEIVADKNIAVSQLFEHLAYELKAQHVRMLALAGLYAQGVGPIVPPGEAFELFSRINRRYSIEAYPIDVQPLASEVKGEPPPAELQKLFEEGKYRDPNPNIDEPGFHKPHKLAFTYLKVSFTLFLDEAKKQITDEQIEEAYKKDVEQGLHKVQELPPATAPPGDQKEGETPPAEKPAEKDQQPAEGKPAADKPAAAPSGDKPAEKPANEKGGCDSGDEPPAAKGSAERPATTPPPAEKSADTKPGEDKTAETKEEPSKPAAEATPAKEQKFKALSEVRDQILTRLAQPIAEEARKKATSEVVTAIERYGKTYRRYLDVKNVRKTGDLKDPGKLDLVPLAAKYNFPIGETPLVDEYEVSNYEIGQKVQQLDMEALQRRQIRMKSFADIVFTQDEPLYKPEEGRSSEPDVNYIYFRTAEEKPADVTLKEARPQVIEFWKKRKAFELALADAQRLTDKAKGASSLGAVVPDAAKVTTTAPFSWMTTGGFGMGQPELSQVAGIELAGREFMQAVFALRPSESGVAPNQSHAKIYVVRVLNQEPDDERLRSQFLESGYNNLVIMLAQGEALHTSVEWYRGVADQYQVKWQRPPDERRRM